MKTDDQILPHFTQAHIRKKFRGRKPDDFSVDHLTHPARSRCGHHFLVEYPGGVTLEVKLLEAAP